MRLVVGLLVVGFAGIANADAVRIGLVGNGGLLAAAVAQAIAQVQIRQEAFGCDVGELKAGVVEVCPM